MDATAVAYIPWYFEHALLLSLPVAALVVLIGRWLIITIGSRRARQQAGERVRALGQPSVELSPRDEDHVVTVRGTLRVNGEPCARYEDGGPAAATTLEISDARTWFEAPEIETSGHRRAPELLLMVGDRQVRLDGALVVRVGSREVWPGVSITLSDDALATQVLSDGGFDPRKCEGFAVFRSLSNGDEVVARGMVARSRDDASQAVGYRQAAMRWRLHAGDDFGIALAATRKPRFRTPPSLLAAGPALAVAIGIVGWAAWLVDVDSDDALRLCDSPCFTRGACQPVARWGGVGVSVECIDSGTPDCARMRDCIELGRCSAVEGACVATSREDCAGVEMCRNHGRCTPRDGKCQVGSNDDCAASAVCAEHGLCTAHVELFPPACGFGSDAECEKTPDCRLRGLCTHRRGRCVTAKRADCAQARYCEQEGLCSFDPKRRICYAKSDADCRGSRACEVDGRCWAQEDVCRPGRRQREPY